MASNTPRFSLNTYDQGDTGWDHTDVVEHADENTIGRGSLSARPSSGTYNNQLYYATDVYTLYRWDTGDDAWESDTVVIPTDDLTSTSGGAAGELRRHDGTGLLPDGTMCRWDGSNWRLLEGTSFSYSGDGTTGRTLATDFRFEQVVVEESGGNVSDAYAGGLSDGALATFAFEGELIVESTGGVTIGDNDANADPNTDGETYEVHVQ